MKKLNYNKIIENLILIALGKVQNILMKLKIKENKMAK